MRNTSDSFDDKAVLIRGGSETDTSSKGPQGRSKIKCARKDAHKKRERRLVCSLAAHSGFCQHRQRNEREGGWSALRLVEGGRGPAFEIDEAVEFFICLSLFPPLVSSSDSRILVILDWSDKKRRSRRRRRRRRQSTANDTRMNRDRRR